MPHDAPQAARLLPAIAPTPLAANEPAITPVNNSVLSATDEAVESLFAKFSISLFTSRVENTKKFGKCGPHFFPIGLFSLTLLYFKSV